MHSKGRRGAFAFRLFSDSLEGAAGRIAALFAILAAANLDRIARGQEPVLPPPTTVLGGLMRYLRDSDPAHFAPMNSNFGLLDPLPQRVKDKEEKRAILSRRAQDDFAAWMAEHGLRSERAVAGA